MLILLVALWAIIAAYFFVTDENRVRRIAADYLGGLVGGQVRIEGASLSLFEGLRLRSVQLLVPDGDGPQSTLLDAGTVIINCNLRELLAGRLTARQIIIVSPHVSLAEDASTASWNYQLLGQKRWPAGHGTGRFTAMPEVLLRDARVDYFEVRDGTAAQVGWMA